MRLLTINLLAVALLLFSAATASAFRVDMSSAQNGATLSNGQQVIIDIELDTEGVGDLNLLAFGVIFDTARVAYNQSASSTTTYLLWDGTKKGATLVPIASCKSAPSGCGLYGLNPAQVQMDWSSDSSPGGVSSDTANDQTYASASATGTAGGLVRLVFDVTGADGGDASFVFEFQNATGGILQLGSASGFTEPGLTLGSTVLVHTIPEPTTALLIGLGLVGLGVAGRRR